MKNSQHTPKHAGDVTKSLKKAAFSYVSLFLIIMVLVGTTISWFTVQDTATLKSDVMVFNSGSGLRVNDGEDITNHITVKNFTLDETSSVDGRNIFLPNGKLQSGVTGDMLYREATAGDKNNKFMYADFKLKGNSAGNIPVYIKSYKITVGKEGNSNYEVYDGSTEITYSDSKKLKPKDISTHKKCPLRIAFIEDSQDTPKVIDPSVLVNESVWKYNAVNSVDSTGAPSTTQSTANSFSHYYFANSTSGTPLFNLNGSTAINATIVAWLEGTDDELGQSKSNDFAGLPISIDIELESNYEDMETVTFVDKTKGDAISDKDREINWIGNGNCMVTMTYTDVTTTTKNSEGVEEHPVRTVVMTASKYKGDNPNNNVVEWTAPIPKAVITDITFNRYHYSKDYGTDHNCKEEIFNAWYTNDRIMDMWNEVAHSVVTLDNGDLQKSRQFTVNEVKKNSLRYVAIRGNGYGETGSAAQRLSPCVGYWDMPSTPTSSTVASTSPPKELDEFNVIIKLDVKDSLSFSGDESGKKMKEYLAQGKKFEVIFEDSQGKTTINEMLTAHDNSSVSYTKNKVPKGTKIVEFRMNVDSSHTYKLTVADTVDDIPQNYYEIKGTKIDVNPIFTTQDDGMTAKHTSG